jgi:hypothetical protein
LPRHFLRGTESPGYLLGEIENVVIHRTVTTTLSTKTKAKHLLPVGAASVRPRLAFPAHRERHPENGQTSTVMLAARKVEKTARESATGFCQERVKSAKRDKSLIQSFGVELTPLAETLKRPGTGRFVSRGSRGSQQAHCRCCARTRSTTGTTKKALCYRPDKRMQEGDPNNVRQPNRGALQGRVRYPHKRENN